MSDHDCGKCADFESCTHIRENITSFWPEDEYLYYLTYVAGYAVITTNAAEPSLGYNYTTSVFCVGNRALGDYDSVSLKEATKRTLHRQMHDWEYAVDTHDFIVLGLNEKMLVLSE